jgi:hypothetical protein
VNFALADWSIRIYSNPVKATLQAKFYTDRTGLIQLPLIDMLGRVVLKTGITVTQGYNNLSIPVPSLRTGVYILSVADETLGRQLQVKLLKK